MQFLVVGAGAVGGYFGGRLAQHGQNVTFLVRPARAAELAARGLVIQSQLGDATIASPQTVQAGAIARPYDMIILSSKAYDLAACVADIRPAVGPDTVIIPMLNGMQHLAVLDGEFGRRAVFGGLAEISSTLNAAKEIVHLNTMQSLAIGARDAAMQDRAAAIHGVMAQAFGARLSTDIEHDMWEKWVFIASLAAITTLMGTSINHIVTAPGGLEFAKAVAAECDAVARAHGHPPRPEMWTRLDPLLFSATSPLMASMARDLLAGHRIEADAVIGDLLRQGEAKGVATPLLAVVYTRLKAYENARAAG